MSRAIKLEYDLLHAPEKVWRALTDPTLVAKWLMSCDLVPERGRQFQFRTEPSKWWDGIVHCRVLDCEPHERISYTWRSGDLDTIVTWTLSATATGGTHLVLEHSGFPDEGGFAYEGALKGWDRNIDQKMRELLVQA